jgi:membrane-associated phospholipid phosphatase
VIVRRYWVVIICAILLLATSLVRIFFGIHFLFDIFGGWLLGLLLLAGRLSRPARFALFVIIAAIPILLVVPAYLSLGSW